MEHLLAILFALALTSVSMTLVPWHARSRQNGHHAGPTHAA
jgi:hypothetical protein